MKMKMATGQEALDGMRASVGGTDPEPRNIIMQEPAKRPTAVEARAMVEAKRLDLSHLTQWIEPIYKGITAAASNGETIYHAQVLDFCDEAAQLTRKDLASIVEMLKNDGYIVYQDGGILSINWGRQA